MVSSPPASLFDRTYSRLPPSIKNIARSARSLVPFPWRAGLSFGQLHRSFWHTQSLRKETRRNLQLQQVRRVVQHAATTVPAYWRMFAAQGIAPTDIRSFSDFAQLPLTTKEQLQDNPEAYYSRAVPASERVMRTTSGSTGTPLRIATTQETQTAEAALMYRGWRWVGYQPDDRVAICVGELSRVTGGNDDAPLDRYRNELELSPHHLNEVGCRAYIDALRDFDPQFIRTYPSVLLILGKYLQEQNVKLPNLKGLWTQSEVVYPEDRKLLEEVWGAPLRDYYGMQEKCVAMSECEHGSMHIHSDFGLVELLPSKQPRYHHIVATGFYNEAMPLLRYATGDLAIPLEEPCPCGRALPAIERVCGRIEDFIYASDGRPVMEMDAAIAHLRNIRQCQLVQESLRSCRVLVVPAPNFSDCDSALLRNTVRAQLGADVDVVVERRETLVRTSTGKLRFIVNKMSEGCQL